MQVKFAASKTLSSYKLQKQPSTLLREYSTIFSQGVKRYFKEEEGGTFMMAISFY